MRRPDRKLTPTQKSGGLVSKVETREERLGLGYIVRYGTWDMPVGMHLACVTTMRGTGTDDISSQRLRAADNGKNRTETVEVY